MSSDRTVRAPRTSCGRPISSLASSTRVSRRHTFRWTSSWSPTTAWRMSLAITSPSTTSRQTCHRISCGRWTAACTPSRIAMRPGSSRSCSTPATSSWCIVARRSRKRSTSPRTHGPATRSSWRPEPTRFARSLRHPTSASRTPGRTAGIRRWCPTSRRHSSPRARTSGPVSSFPRSRTWTCIHSWRRSSASTSPILGSGPIDGHIEPVEAALVAVPAAATR